MTTQFRHGRGTQILVDEHDVSVYFRDASSASSVDVADSTAFLSDTKTYVVGTADGRLTLGGMFSGDAGGVDEVFNEVFGVEDAVSFTYAPEGLAVGRRVWGLKGFVTSYNVSSSVASIVAVQAEIQGTGGVKSGLSLSTPATALVATGNGTPVDGSAASVNGALVNIHMMTNDDSAAQVHVQHSTSSGGTYADISGAALTLTDSQVGGFQIVIPAGVTVNRWVRVRTVFTDGTSLTHHVNLVRL